MSDIGTFFMCFRDREPALFKRSLFVEIFSRGAFVPSSSFSDIEYADGYTDIDIADDAEINGMSFSRSWGDTFITNMLDLADLTGSCILWPDEESKLIVTDRAVLNHLPLELLEDPVHVVRTPRDYRDVIAWVEPSPADVAEQLARSAAERAQGTDDPARFWPFRLMRG